MGMHTHTLRRVTASLSAIVAGVIVPSVTFAQVVGGGTLPVNQTYDVISKYTVLVAQFLNIMTWFVFSFLIFLLDPRFMFDMKDGVEGSLMEVLNLIWRLSRDLMNVGFAVGLVGAAIYTVVKADKEFVSAHLKTFVMAVVLVNFSWFIPRVILDVANIATATVYSIPTAITNPAAQCTYTSVKEEGCIKADAGGAALPPGEMLCKCKAVADFIPFPGTKKAEDLKEKDKTWQCYWLYCVRFVELDPKTSTKQGGVLNGLIINHARLPQLAVVTRTDVDGDIADLLLFILRQMVVIMIHIAILFPLVALLIALVVRIPILWMTIAFMPFYFVSWVIPDEIPGMGQVKEFADKILSLFLKAAFLPAAVAVPLSIGYLMANAGSRVSFDGIKDMPFNLIDGMGNFGQLLWVIMVLGILWTGTFTVLEMMMSGMPGEGLIGQIKETGEQAGKFAAELPLSSVPLPGVAGNNLLKFGKMFGAEGIRNARSTLQRGGPSALLGAATGGFKDEDILKTRGQDIAKEKDGKDKFVKALDEFSGKDAGSLKVDDIQVIFKDQLKGTGVTLTDDNFKKHIGDLMKTLNLDDGKIRAFNTQADKYINLKKAGGGAPAPGGAPGAPPAPVI